MAKHAPNAHATHRVRSLRRQGIIVAAGLAALAAAWWLLPRPDLEEPCGGPRWYRTLRHLEYHIPRLLGEYAATHGGRFPDNLADLAPEQFPPIVNPARQKIAWECRPGWDRATWIFLATIVVWPVALLWTRYRLAIGLIAVVLTVVGGVRAIDLARRGALPPPGYEYLDWFRILPGMEEPVPPSVPMLWVEDDYPRRAAFERGGTIGGVGSVRYRGGVQPRLDLERVAQTVRSRQADIETLLAKADQCDRHATMALALRRERAAANVFARCEADGPPRQIALWGLWLLRDERAGPAALRALAATDAETRAYAAKLVGLLHPDGATRALLPLLDGKDFQARIAALESIGCDGDPAAIGVLAEALAARPARGRLSWAEEQAIWKALARTGTPEAFDLFLREADRYERRWKRAQILELLAEGGEAAVPVLTQLLNSESEEVRKAARKALETIRSGAALEPAGGR